MSISRELNHWKANRRRWLRRHDIWPPRRGPLPLFCALVRRSKRM
jgi:hypothetical protein